MADETPDTPPSPAKPGRKKLFLILGIIVVPLASAAGWYVLKSKSKPEPPAEVKTEELLPDTPKKKLERQTKKEYEISLKKQEKAEAKLLKNKQIPGGILVPLTRHAVTYQARNWEYYKRGDTHRIMVAEIDRTADRLTVPAHPDRIVVNLAQSSGNAVLVLELAMRVARLDSITRINERNHRLFDRLFTIISKKTQIEANRSGFRQRLENDLLAWPRSTSFLATGRSLNLYSFDIAWTKEHAESADNKAHLLEGVGFIVKHVSISLSGTGITFDAFNLI